METSIINHETPPLKSLNHLHGPFGVLLLHLGILVVKADLQARGWVLAYKGKRGLPCLNLGGQETGHVKGMIHLPLEAGRAVVDPAERQLE